MENTDIATLTEKQLCALEDQVRKGSAAFVAVGNALAKIREGKGYRLRGFDTFEDYCDKVFGITDRHGRRLIQSAAQAAEVKKLTGAMPANESVAREWAHLADRPEQLKQVVDQIEKRGYSVVTATAEAVKEAVQKLAPKAKPPLAAQTGKAVLLPSLGGYPAKQAALAQPAKLASPTGECPWCHERPNTYVQSEETWQCENCEGIVMLSVIAWLPQAAPKNGKNGAQGGPLCPHCKKPIQPGDPFCGVCGSIL